MAKDLYEILGVARTTDKEEIRKKYKKLARRHHPDVNPGDKDAERRFKEINAAYAVLSDEDIRARVLTVDEARAMLKRGDIVDLKTAYGLTLL